MITPKITSKNSMTIGPCRLCYTNLFEKKKFEGDTGDGKYSAIVLIPKTEKETVKAIKAMIEETKTAGMASKWNGSIPRNYRDPLNDGDDKEDAAFTQCWYLNAKSNNRPIVVGKDRHPITDPEDIYSGVWAYVSIGFYPYNSNGGKGVGVFINSVMKYKDDERLGASGPSIDAAFGDIDDDDEM